MWLWDVWSSCTITNTTAVAVCCSVPVSEHGREGGHFALQKRPHNLVAPNAIAYIATSQKGMACTPRDPKCGRFFFIFLDFGQISPPAIFGQPWPAKGGGGGGGEGGFNPPSRG